MKSKISSSLLLVLLCLGVFHFNQVQAGACAASKTTCATCDDAVNTKCLTCKTGYYLESDDCKTCADTTQYLPAAKTTTGKATDCVAGPANCATTESDGSGKCKTCKTNYKISGDALKCETCPDKDKYFDGTNCVLCVQAADGTCTECNVFGTCKTCPPNLVLTGAGKKCIACSDTTKYLPTGKTKDYECVSCGTGCKTCNADGSKCLTCNDGYKLDTADNKCKGCADITQYLPTGQTQCVAGPDNCAEALAGGTKKCKTCKPTYALSADFATCSACPAGKYLPPGKSAADDCVYCTLGCSTCNLDGTCTACADGRYLKDGQCVPCVAGCKKCDKDNKCLTCNDGYAPASGAGACTACPAGCKACDTSGKCTACVTAPIYAFDNTAGACIACPAGCTACGTDKKCTTCVTNGYVFISSSGVCKACGTGCDGCTADGVCTKAASGYVVDSNNVVKPCPTGCTDCNDDTGKCTKCATNYYFATDACTACPAGKYVAIAGNGQQASTDCKACDPKKFYKTTTNTCEDCKDDNCLICSGDGLGHCLTCAADYTLVKGTCTASGTTIKRTGSVTGKVRFNMDEETFKKYGGANHFVAATAKATGVPADLIDVTGTEKGSLIVLFRIFSSGTATAADIRAAINKAIASGTYGDTNPFEGALIIDSNAVVLLPGGCSPGQYYDAENYECKACTEDKCGGKKKSKHLGAILGGVLGGAALILIIAVIVAKKTNLFAKKSKSPKSAGAQYNLAANSPTNPTVENERV